MNLPVGPEVDFKLARRPEHTELRGAYARLRPVLASTDAEPLYALSHAPTGDPSIWTYLFDGPYDDPNDFRRTLEAAERSRDPLFFAIVRPFEEGPLGLASYMRITREHGVIEIGNIWYGPPLQRTTAATEVIYLLARHAFDDLGYRRLEWKCNALNAASRRAAERYGFEFEGVFRNHMVVKGRNRDTAWYAITDARWPAIRSGFVGWLAPDNFDEHGRQRRPLRELMTHP